MEDRGYQCRAPGQPYLHPPAKGKDNKPPLVNVTGAGSVVMLLWTRMDGIVNTPTLGAPASLEDDVPSLPIMRSTTPQFPPQSR